MSRRGATVARGYRCVVCLPVFHNMMASNNRRRRGDSSDSSSGSSSGDDDGGGGADSEATLQTPALKFKNDGSFLEMFKKMQQQGVHNERVMKQPCDSAKESLPPPQAPQAPQPPSAGPSDSSKAPVAPPPCKPQGLLSLVGKRRGGKILPTGVVKKQKVPDDADDNVQKDAWSQYMTEVRKYKERLGDEEDKNRPLVK